MCKAYISFLETMDFSNLATLRIDLKQICNAVATESVISSSPAGFVSLGYMYTAKRLSPTCKRLTPFPAENGTRNTLASIRQPASHNAMSYQINHLQYTKLEFVHHQLTNQNVHVDRYLPLLSARKRHAPSPPSERNYE